MIFKKILSITNQKMVLKSMSTSSAKFGYSTNKTVFLFGGQGNQEKGMLDKFLENS